jgi:hypothetical protein
VALPKDEPRPFFLIAARTQSLIMFDAGAERLSVISAPGWGRHMMGGSARAVNFKGALANVHFSGRQNL